MNLGEVCLETNNVIKIADFYRKVLNISSDCKDEVHQLLFRRFHRDFAFNWHNNPWVVLPPVSWVMQPESLKISIIVYRLLLFCYNINIIY